MCGIVGYVGTDHSVEVLLGGLRRLEYRGYDSAGVAVLDDDGELGVRKRAGKLAVLAGELESDGIAVNLVAPSTAISTPGSDRYVPADYPTEPVEYLAEVAYEMCRLPAAERTGLVAHSLHWARAMGLACRDLDTGAPLPTPEIPAYAHPEILARGE